MRLIIPNALGSVMVAVTFTMAGAIGLESGLSFLGIDVQPSGASWGAVIGAGLVSWRFYPWLLAAPALILGIVSLALPSSQRGEGRCREAFSGCFRETTLI